MGQLRYILKRHTLSCLILLPSVFCNSCSNNQTFFNAEYDLTINSQSSEKLYLGDYCNKIELIPLQTLKESLIGNCKKVEFYDNKFYILDDIQHAIFVFDSSGRYLFNTINFKGRGPGQYSNLSDFNINLRTESIEVLDASANRIILYNLNGLFKGTIALSPKLSPISNFEFLTDDIYVFYHRYSQLRNDCLVFYSVSKRKVLKTVMPVPKSLKDITVTNKNPFFNSHGSIFFYPMFPESTIYSINPDELSFKKYISLDFGENTFSYDLIPEDRPKEFYRAFFRNYNNKYAFLIDIKENTNIILIYYYHRNRTYVVRFNKSTYTQQVSFNSTNEIGQMPVANFIDDVYLYYFCEPEYLQYSILIGLLDESSREVLRKLKSNDNPILIKYKLK